MASVRYPTQKVALPTPLHILFWVVHSHRLYLSKFGGSRRKFFENQFEKSLWVSKSRGAVVARRSYIIRQTYMTTIW